MMYKIRITNRLWLKGGDYGEYETRSEARAQMPEYEMQSDADKWFHVSGDCSYAYLNEFPNTVALTMEVIEVQS